MNLKSCVHVDNGPCGLSLPTECGGSVKQCCRDGGHSLCPNSFIVFSVSVQCGWACCCVFCSSFLGKRPTGKVGNEKQKLRDGDKLCHFNQLCMRVCVSRLVTFSTTTTRHIFRVRQSLLSFSLPPADGNYSSDTDPILCLAKESIIRLNVYSILDSVFYYSPRRTW